MSNVSPYTRVIAECLHSLSGDKTDDCACDIKQVSVNIETDASDHQPIRLVLDV